jgi:hypothetical protein
VIAPVVFLLLLVAAAIAIHQLTGVRRIRRQLRAAPRTAIAGAAAGRVQRFVGRAVVLPGGTQLVAPLTGRPCVYYVAIVEEQVYRGKNTRWRQRIREIRSVPFGLADGTGQAQVDLTGAELDVAIDHATRSGIFDPAAPAEEAMLRRHGLSSTGWVFNRALRYREGAIEIGEPIAVAGRPQLVPDYAAQTQLLLRSLDQRLLVSDVRGATTG